MLLLMVYIIIINKGHIQIVYIPIITRIGISVNYSATIGGIEVGPAVIRCILLCWTGDHPAQCEVGKFLGTGGAHPCRRDKVEGT